MSDSQGVLVKEAPSRTGRTTPAAGASHVVEVSLKPEFPDAEGACALRLLHAAGVNTVRYVRVSRLYEVSGPINLGHMNLAMRELLCDYVTQESRLCQSLSTAANGGSLWRVEVWLKPAVTDTVGDSVRSALQELGIPEAVSVRCGRAYHIVGKCGRNQLEKAVLRSLANPVIHHTSISEAH
ncbi:MAG: phosphoribosylformylglycinamidine synthase subunit PurS [Elusimicrobiota bacterium]|jgi:phosphoribosylformylglycinamidine synthase